MKIQYEAAGAEESSSGEDHMGVNRVKITPGTEISKRDDGLSVVRYEGFYSYHGILWGRKVYAFVCAERHG